MNPLITSIHVTRSANGRYLTTIYYLDATGNLSMADRQDLHLQGVEEFIRDFRIKHDM